jgi:hypothetical protein
MAGAVLRPTGSTRKFSRGISGACCMSSSACSRAVTTRICSGLNMGSRRSTVSWNIVRSPRSRSICLGRLCRLSGHSRVPLPPARITANISPAIRHLPSHFADSQIPAENRACRPTPAVRPDSSSAREPVRRMNSTSKGLRPVGLAGRMNPASAFGHRSAAPPKGHPLRRRRPTLQASEGRFPSAPRPSAIGRPAPTEKTSLASAKADAWRTSASGGRFQSAPRPSAIGRPAPTEKTSLA